MILPKEPCSISTKEKITCMWLGPNEWFLVSNDTITKDSNDYELEKVLFKNRITSCNNSYFANCFESFLMFIYNYHVYDTPSELFNNSKPVLVRVHVSNFISDAFNAYLEKSNRTTNGAVPEDGPF